MVLDEPRHSSRSLRRRFCNMWKDLIEHTSQTSSNAALASLESLDKDEEEGTRMKAATSLMVASLLLLTGCATSFAYKYNNLSYITREAALVAVRADVDDRVNATPVSASKIGGSVEILVPTRDVIRQYGVKNGAAARDDQVEYIVDVLELGFLGRARAVAKSQVFDKTTVFRAPDVEHYAIEGYDYKLWLYAAGSGSWQWYLSKAGATGREPVTVDMGLPASQREGSFSDSIYRAANVLGVAVASRGPAPPDAGAKSGGTSVSQGTGFFINGEGAAITNAHVVKDCGSVRALVPGGEIAAASVVASDRENDLALVKVSVRNKSHAQFRVGWPVRQGEPIVVYGFPLAGALASTGNLTTGIVSALAGLGDDTSKLQISAPVQPGNSGGPVLDQNGGVIGVVVSKLNAIKAASITGDIPQNVNFAIKTGVATAFLEANGAGFSTTQVRKALPTEDIGDEAKAFTFIIECR